MNTISLDLKNQKILEKYSSTYTLSDMEIFIFPDLLFPLVLANIMSPVIWKWRNNPWFKDVHKRTFTYKINRVKQFIMDHYAFNLDLETWGLTTKEKEINRFKDFLNTDVLKQSNALFGYEGDKYYFDIDIRKHFGLDKYNEDTIPYWKTETVEAMTAFRFRRGFENGAGECVSLAALYAAALFVVGRVPLEKIFMISTPLHSQNFINVDEGVLTNNRRIVTKKMWFNGTLLSARARRAMENEKVTVVSHISGYIHYVYEKATIHPLAYKVFSNSFHQYLKTALTPEILINYLRYEQNFKKCFQYKYFFNGKYHFIELEKIFAYEHLSKISFNDNSRTAFFEEVDPEDFSLVPIDGRMCFCDMEDFLNNHNNLSFDDIKNHFINVAEETKCNNIENIKMLFEGLYKFINLEPRLPQANKIYENEKLLEVNLNLNREEIIAYITKEAEKNETARLALYTYRQMEKIDWLPFIKAAVERNPVSVEALKGKTAKDVVKILNDMPNDSIYDGKRLAQPDEVWNFNRGDGIEKALLLANFFFNSNKKDSMILLINENKALLKHKEKQYTFNTYKGFDMKEVQIPL